MAETDADDPLLGTWSVSGGTWNISGGPGTYQIVETGALGQSGSGIVRLSGNNVRIEMAHVFFGSIAYDLQLDRASNRMTGTFLGVPVVAVRGAARAARSMRGVLRIREANLPIMRRSADNLDTWYVAADPMPCLLCER